MKATTQIRLALRLFPHLEELIGLHTLDPQEVLLLYHALTAWIGFLQDQQATREAGMRALVAPARPRLYRLQDRFAARTRLWVEEEGQPARLLPHVPLFCPWGFGLDSLAARDTALAILADHFGEPLSKRTFLQGQGLACRYYPALAAFLLTSLCQGRLTTQEVVALLTDGNQRWWKTAFFPPPRGN